MFTIQRIAGCGVAAVLMCAGASAAVVVDDSFNDGGRTNGADPKDVAWYVTGDGALTTVASNTLQLNGVGRQRTLMAFFPKVTLTNVNDSVTFQANIRLFRPATVANWNSFNFVLGNSNGTQQTGDSYNPTPGVRSDDKYYLSSFNTTNGSGSNNFSGGIPLFQATMAANAENFTNGTRLNPTGTGTPGSANTAAFYATGNPALPISLTVKKTAGGMLVSSQINGGSIASATDATNYISSFDMVMLQNAGSSGTAATTWYLDDVQVTTVVPEPSIVAGFAGVSGMMVLRRRRQR